MEKKELGREDVIEALKKIAFGRVNRGVELTYLSEPTAALIRKMDLSTVAEFKRNANGTVEVKFVDRVKALSALYEMLGGGDANEAAEFLEALEQAGIRFDAVVALEVPDEKIVDRMGGRRVCESCGASYHVVNIPPKKEGVCDVCGGALKQRKDDDPETVRDRLAVYHKETEPLKGFYEARGILKTVDDYPTVEETTQAILKVLGC